MDLKHLALCHCSNHAELFLYETGKEPVSFRSPELKDNVIYVSPRCPEPDPTTLPSLNKVPPNSVDYIWPINCPMYPALRGEEDHNQVFNDIMTYGWNSLKVGGKVIFKTMKPDEYQSGTNVEYATDLIKRTSKKPWKVEYIEDFTTLPLFADRKGYFRKFKNQPPTSVFVLTKLSNGGKKTRRRRKTRKVLRRSK